MYNIKEVLKNPKLLEIVSKRIFEAVDEDGSARISEDELHTILGSLADNFGFERPTVDDTEKILNLVDLDRSGLIDLGEFTRFLKKVLKAVRDDDEKNKKKKKKDGDIDDDEEIDEDDDLY
jgi:Ca2+-binding EF-hand superfamily protein